MRAAPLATFRLYPEEGSRLYARAYVWPTQKAMHEHLRRVGISRVRTTAAVCLGFTAFRVKPGRADRMLPIFARVHFYRRCMGGGLVAHELLHVTCAWARRIGLPPEAFNLLAPGVDVAYEEERMCQAHGRMVAAFVSRAHRLGFYG